MAVERKKLVHIHSNVPDKQPTPSTLTEGELAVNYASGNEFISLKNTENKVVRVSSDPVIMGWVEKKEVFPTGATVSSNTNNASTMTLKLNQKPGKLSPSSGVGSSITIDTSSYASTGANVTFRDVTVTGNLTAREDVLVGAGSGGGSLPNVTVNASDVDINAINANLEADQTLLLSGDTVNIYSSGSGINMSGATSISGNTNIKGALTANTTTINGDLNVTGSSMNIDLDEDAKIYAFDGITLGNNVTVNGSMGVKDDFSVGIGQTGSDIPDVNVNAYGMTLSGYNSHLYAGNSLDIKGSGVHIEATAPVGYAGVDIKSNNGVNISAATNITGNTAIDGTLDVKSGLTKSASWSYGSVSGGTSGSYNGSTNKSFTIPKSIEHLSNYSAGTVTLDDDIVIKKDLYVSGSIITTGSSAQQNLNLNYGDVRNASNATYNGTAEKTVAIPKSIDHLTNYDGTTITMPHSVKVSGAVTADGGLVVKNGATISGDVTVADADDVSIKATNEVSFRTQIVSTNGTINVENGANISGSTKISGNTTILGQLNVTNGLVVTGATTISGNTTINGTLDVPSGLTKSASWSYGNVSAATSGSYNGSADKSVTIPKSIDHLTNYDGTSINLPHNVKVSGTISANSAIYSSDVKLKENVSAITDEDITKVKSVQLKSFNLKDDKDKRKVYGVIAQEVEAAKLDELVHIAEDGTKGVDYTSLFVLKMAALEAEVKALRNEVLHLNMKLEELKK